MGARVYITGASGTGTTTLGAALAHEIGVAHLDTDDYYWAPSDLPFTERRPRAARAAALRAAQGSGGWVLSGSADGWGDAALEGARLVVFLTLPTALRLARLRRREAARFGDRIAPGGDMHRNHRDFLRWTASYDDPWFRGRSLARHRAWLAAQPAPVLELSGAEPTQVQVAACSEALAVRVAE